jgi:uncharacterized protein YfdQ (DUF2303 family)
MADKQTEPTLFPVINETPPRGDIMEKMGKFFDEHLKPTLFQVEDPLTKVVAPAILTPSGVEAIPASVFDDYLPAPRARSGTARLTSLDSFIRLVQRFKSDDTAIFANDSRSTPSLTAVLDYHAEGANSKASHGRHRVTFAYPLSDEWNSWQAVNGKPMNMRDFAELVEDRIVDVEPYSSGSLNEDQQAFVEKLGGRERIATPTSLFELSRGLSVHQNAAVKESRNLSSGEGEISFVEEHVGTDGKPLIIPTTFILVIPVFRNGAYYRVLARLRYRVTPNVTFTVELWRTDRVFDHAFNEAAEKAATETGAPLFLGSPEA